MHFLSHGSSTKNGVITCVLNEELLKVIWCFFFLQMIFSLFSSVGFYHQSCTHFKLKIFRRILFAHVD